MILSAARLALRDILSPPFRDALWKVLGVTILILIGLWFAIDWAAAQFALPYVSDWFAGSPAWVDDAGTAAGWLGGLLLALGLAYLVGPISAMVAGLFLDDVAEVVERESYPGAPTGTALPLVQGAWLALKFLGVVLAGNALALFLLLVPGVNIVAFFLVNGYLLGREYFEFAALRYRPEAEAKAMRQRHAGTVFLAGLAIAAFLAIPFVNLLTPLFAAAMMVHLHQRVAARSGEGLLPKAAAPAADA